MNKILFLLCSLILNSSLLYAGLIVTPSKNEISMAPGQTFEGRFTVKNDYSVPTSIKVETRNWFLLPRDSEVAISSWMAVQNPEIRLQPGEQQDVRYQVQLSTDAEGVRVGMVSFIPSIEEGGLTLVISASVFVTAVGTENVAWNMDNIDIKKDQDHLQVSAMIKNSGNVHLRPAGTVQILSRKKEIASFDFREGRPVYPEMQRSIVAVSDSSVSLSKGKYAAVLTIRGAGQEKKQTVKFKVGRTGEIIKK